MQGIFFSTSESDPVIGIKCSNNKRCTAPVLVQLLLILLCGAWAHADALNPAEYRVKAAFLYKFCLYVEWPKESFADADSPIVLGIVAPDYFVHLVQAIVQTRTIGERPLVVRHIGQYAEGQGGGQDADGKDAKGRNTDMDDLHLLFIAKSERGRTRRLLARVEGQPTLVITESRRGLDVGSDINFVIQDNRVRFDVALASVERKRLRLRAQLLKVARDVRGAP